MIDLKWKVVTCKICKVSQLHPGVEFDGSDRCFKLQLAPTLNDRHTDSFKDALICTQLRAYVMIHKDSQCGPAHTHTQRHIQTYTDTHTHTYIYIVALVWLCVCVNRNIDTCIFK